MIKFEPLQIQELSQWLGKNDEDTKDWCNRFDVPIFTEDEIEFVFTCQVESVWLTNLIIYLKGKYGEQWKRKLRRYMK